jgi:NAD(P)-dependent dehydrogenase (short-subunit alcohol dehydrogenase family)
MKGRRIVITGGGSGIGLATARLCLAQGARVGVIDLTPMPAGEIVSSVADVRSTEAVGTAMQRLARDLGGIDGLVNAAGIDLQRALAETTDDEWERIIDVNLTGAMRVCRAALAELQRSGKATIVNVASGAALMPLKHRTAYCAAKAGLVMFGKALAIELAPDIRVNSVCPGAVDTPLFHTSYETEAQLEEIKKRYLLRRPADADELARAIVFLLGEDSSYMTGAAIAVDGGRTFH